MGSVTYIYKKKYCKIDNKANREKYTVLECRWSNFIKNTQEFILNEAETLCQNANIKRANTGKNRYFEKKYIDCLAGIMAEFAVLEYFKKLQLPYKISRPTVNTSFNQIDILLEEYDNSKKYSVEVRASFLKNGMYFALYAINKNTKKSYFDIIGTYKQESYKINFEPEKNLYMRVFYDIYDENYVDFFHNENNFIDKFIIDDEPFYVVGGMSGEDIKNKGYLKKMNQNNSETLTDNYGEYHVAEIFYIHDIEEFSLPGFLEGLLEKN